MDIVRLKEDVLLLLEENVEILAMSAEEAVMAGFTLNSPAVTLPIPGGWQIILNNSLSPEKQLAMLAHELGHLLIKGEGVYEVHMDEDLAVDYLVEEVNSVITHHFVVDRLAADYGIESNFYLQLRMSILEDGQRIIEEASGESLILHGLGLHLLDLIITTDGEEEQIRELLNRNPCVKQAFELGEEFLIYPTLSITAEEQYQRVKNFFTALEYSKEGIRLTGK